MRSILFDGIFSKKASGTLAIYTCIPISSPKESLDNLCWTGIKCLDKKVLQVLEISITALAEVVFHPTPVILNRVEFAMEFGEEDASVSGISDNLHENRSAYNL